MDLALSEARQALGSTSPNPAVGAVLVKERVVVGQGFTQPPGSAHAEVMALRGAGERARGATLYVTLEPCCHFGRTPPCTGAIIEAGIAEVHMATLDPNPLVAGKGKAALEQAGIRTYLGEHKEEAEELNEAYIKHITSGLPLVTAKFALSLDGKLATRSRDSRWITGTEARERVHQLRSQVDAIMVGVGTVLSDDPQLTARPGGARAERQPKRIVVDSRGNTPPTARMLREPGVTIIAATALAAPDWKATMEQAGAEAIDLPSRAGGVDLAALMKVLGQRGVISLLVEGGGTLLGSLFSEGLVDKVCAFIAPTIIGGKEAVGIGGPGVERMTEAQRLTRVRVERLGDDILVIGYLIR